MAATPGRPNCAIGAIVQGEPDPNDGEREGHENERERSGDRSLSDTKETHAEPGLQDRFHDRNPGRRETPGTLDRPDERLHGAGREEKETREPRGIAKRHGAVPIER